MDELRLRSDELNWREIDGEVVAVDVPTSTYLSANSAGAMLWQMLASGTTRDALANRLVDEFGIPPGQAESDVKAFIDSLAARGLLER